MDSAMSASLASARMNSLHPRGSAWMRASFTSSDFCTMTGSTCERSAAREGHRSDDSGEQRLGAEEGPAVDEEQQPGQDVHPGEDELGPAFLLTDQPEANQQHQCQGVDY